MVSISVPDIQREALLAVTKVDVDTFQSIASALGALAPAATRREFADAVTVALGETPALNPEVLVTAIIRAHETAAANGWSPARMAQLLIQAMQIPSGPAAEVTHQRLATLLQVESLALHGKALGLSLEYERVFSSARIVTDIRPVFSTESASVVSDAIVMHQMCLTYWHEGAEAAMYVALDGGDLRLLHDAVTRALEKSDAVSARLGQAGLTRIPTLDED